MIASKVNCTIQRVSSVHVPLKSRRFNKNSGSWNRVTHLGLEPVSS